MANEIKGVGTNRPTLPAPSKLIKTGTNTPANSISNTGNSLSEVTKKTAKNPTSVVTQKTLTEKVESAFKNGLDYLKGVRDQATKDRQSGIKPLEGANNLWTQLVAKAEEIGQKAQDHVLDGFANEAAKEVTDKISGTKLGDFLDDILGKQTTAGTNKTASTAIAAANTTGAEALSTTAGAASTKAPSAVAGVAAQGEKGLLSGLSGTLGKAASGIGAAYSLYSLFNDFGKSSPMVSGMHGATVGAYVGSIIPGVGTVIGGLVGFAAGAVLGFFNKGKHPDAIVRDNMRNGLKEAGFLDQSNSLTLADGSKYSFATDGKKKLPGIDGKERFGYQIDFANSLTSQAIGWMQPLAEVMTQGNQKLKTDLLGYMVNAATSNAKTEAEVRANVASIYQQSKLDPEMVLTGLAELTQSGKIKEDNIPAYVDGLRSLVKGPDASASSNEVAMAA